MEHKHLRPDKLDVDPSSANASRKWKQWKHLFNNFLNKLIAAGSKKQDPLSDQDKLDILCNHVEFVAFEYISEAVTYQEAIDLLEHAYVKKVNKRFARYLLLNTKQKSGESLEEFLHGLKKLGADCEFEALTINEHKEMAIGDTFIAGLQSNYIRQRLLEGKEDKLQGLFDTARSLEDAQKNSELYTSPDRGLHSSLENSALAMQVDEGQW